ncbi:MAG: hypothetical protein K2F90_05940 [Clostridiales bacterium]|nr:hypothetical protein [Clostridiales bacterium]
MAKKDAAKPAKPAKEKPVKEKKGKDKKDKKSKGAAEGGVPPTGSAPNGMPSAGTPSVPLANLSPDQMTAAQIEQAIKESNDPNTKLKKLRSPLNWRSCLINLAILIVATFAVVILWCWLAVDTFDFGHVMSDMFSKFGITQFFTNLGKTISGWFS